MTKKWQIIYYETLSGKSQVYDFIEKAESRIQAKIANTLDLLEEYGVKLGLPHTKKIIKTNLWELRILGKNNVRIFYIALIDETFLLLHAFAKKKQKTDKREIRIALDRLDDHNKRKLGHSKI